MTVAAQAKQRLVGRFELKSKDESKRTFEGSLSTSHLDLGNGRFRDIVWPGAFDGTLKALHDDGHHIPLLDSHNPTSIFNVLGHMLDGEEVLTGQTLKYKKADGKTLAVPEMLLNVEWQVIDGVDGERLMDRMRPGSVRKMSMGYEVGAFDFVDLADEGKVRNLREVFVGEGSLVVFPMNDNAEVRRDSIKALADLRHAIVNGGGVDELEALLGELQSTAGSVRTMIEDAKATAAAANAPPEDPDDLNAPDTSLLDRLRLLRIRPHHHTTQET
jgi:HK97 family phage prohead protease